ISERIDEILEAVDLSDVSKRKIGTLSGGMKQRLALAQAVMGSPSILILDEPTAGLDPKQRISIRNFISQIALDKIVIFATHVVGDIEHIAKNVIMLKKGVIVDSAPPHELTKKIEGKVWNVTVCEDMLPLMQSEYRVTNISREEGSDRLSLRIISDTKPEGGTHDGEMSDRQVTAKVIAPTLEDFYLYTFEELVN
ncbi:MAG: ATP-binding cassette domain-containing protein, partial [Firmicutes bacterium]|nr:ATP-binding cassette domain-containing protein [Bacillota bacterium]